MQVWMFFLILLVICGIALTVFLLVDANERKRGQIITGTVLEWQSARIPGFGRVIIDYTIRGRHYQCGSCLIPSYRKKSFRVKSMRRYVLHRYMKTKRFDSLYVATPIYT